MSQAQELEWWTERDGIYRADGRDGRSYAILRRADENLPWVVWTDAPRQPRAIWTLSQAKKLAQAWEEVFEVADEMLLKGDFRSAEFLRVEPDEGRDGVD